MSEVFDLMKLWRDNLQVKFSSRLMCARADVIIECNMFAFTDGLYFGSIIVCVSEYMTNAAGWLPPTSTCRHVISNIYVYLDVMLR